MDPQAIDLAKRSALASVTYAAIAGVVFIVLTFLSKIPVFGFGFLCLNFFFFLAAYAGIAYLVTPKLGGFPAGQSKPMLALFTGLGVAAAVTVGVVLANLIGNLFTAVTDGYGPAGITFSLLGALVGGLFGGLVIGTALAFLGSYLALDRNKDLGVARPF